GPYPEFLKQRIRSHKGHLSNHDAAEALAKTDLKIGAHVFLAHLSQKNNRAELAENTVTDHLCNQGCAVGRDIILHATYPNCAVGLVK
ncbi:MAG: MBL fold metallo-hydrolase, partial [Heliobacteriaceae bacterium]|nr:MBL fold metallo-hydrolase [Heliobacteriaceae bacterium]